MTKVKLDIESDDKISNVVVNIVYNNGISTSKIVNINSNDNTEKSIENVNTDDIKPETIVIKQGIDKAFKSSY